MSDLVIKSSWLEPTAEVGKTTTLGELEASHARVQIFLGKQNITENTINRTKHGSIEIPVYYLAEWMAENWWVMLFEPWKDEDEADPGFVGRHSILSAQHGFPLPALSIIPFGHSIRINCSPRKAAFASISFTADVFGDAATEQVKAALTAFLRDTDLRLRKFNIDNTRFQRAWEAVADLPSDERAFCELLGALGVSPDRASDELCTALEELFELLGPRATRDYCFAATPRQVLKARTSVEELTNRLVQLSDAKLDALLSADLPKDNFSAPSWRRGMQAAKHLRERLGIDVKDEGGASKVFDALHINLNRFETNLANNEALPIGGAVDRNGKLAKIALLQTGVAHRRFSAGRAAYLSWVSEEQSRRLITNAVTRDQQASRQFAAEILVPQEYLKKRANNGKLSHDNIIEIASSRGAMPDVAFKQAYNAGISVAAI